MRIKLLSVIASFFITSFVIVSCLGSDNEVTYQVDDTIWAFEIDTIYGDNYRFTIDQIRGLIYNIDSVPYSADTIINKILITELDAATPFIYTGDTILNISDSLNLLNTMKEPLLLKVFSVDGSANREYKVEVRIHQQDPDSLVWKKLSESLSQTTQIGEERKAVTLGSKVLVYNSHQSFYASALSDGKEWSKNTDVNGLPEDIKISSIINYKDQLYALSATGAVFNSTDGITWNQTELGGNVVTLIAALPNGIAAVVADGETNKFAVSDEGAKTWTLGVETPADFPVEYISATNYTTYTGLLKTVITGKTSQESVAKTVPWFTYDGKDWAGMATASEYYLPGMNKPSIAYYNDRLYAYGDKFETFYYSLDGLIWREVERKIRMDEAFQNRTEYSSFVDGDGYIWLIWNNEAGEGKRDEVWKGRINKMGFLIK